MTDRELLEAAARVAGIDLTWIDGKRPGYWSVGEPTLHYDWNPLTDDGDALRLAVKLRLHLEFEESCVSPSTDTAVYRSEPYGDDPYAATRRAIVRAATAVLEKT